MQQYGTDWGSLIASATPRNASHLVLFLFIQKFMISAPCWRREGLG